MGNFKLGGVDMPKPHTWEVDLVPLRTDSERLPATGRFVSNFVCYTKQVIWTYKKLTEDEYKLLYDNYVNSCTVENKGETTITTEDSNTGEVITLIIYVQDDFKAPLYRINNGKREYRNITFTFVGVGGGE